MDVKEAVKIAKEYVSELFKEESLSNLGLEEVEHDDAAGIWKVTVGFSRPWNTVRDAVTIMTGDVAQKRAYRMVLLQDDGKVVSLKRREVAAD